jgi:hypothetical protein
VNVEQVKSAVRWIIATFGPFLIAHGYMSDSTLTLISGAIISLIPLAWSMLTHTQTNAVAVVDTLAKEPDTGVKAVIADSTAAGKALAVAMPGNTTVVAGTVAAAEVAKS